MRGLRLNIVACGVGLALGLGAVSVMADIVNDGFENRDLVVNGYRDGSIVTELAGGEKLYPLSSVITIEIDGEDDFNNAEKARKAGDWAKAAELYATSVNQGRRGERLAKESRAVTAFDKAGMYDKAIRAFLDIYAASPTSATYDLRPQKLPAPSSDLLPTAAEEINEHLRDKAFDTPEIQENLKSMLLAIYTQDKDPRAAKLAHQEVQGTATAAVNNDAAAPVAAAPDIEVTDDLSSLQGGLAAKKYDAVIHQADNMLLAANDATAVQLYLLKGRAYEGLGKTVEAEAAYLRAALYYPQSAQAPNALLAAADLEKKDDAIGAKRLYKEIVDKYPTSVAANKAKGNL